jgi:hypothetical protein
MFPSITAVDDLYGKMTPSEREEVDRLLRAKTKAPRGYYKDKPVAYGRDKFGEFYTDDIQKLMLSVRDNMVTIGESANGVGKTHAAARIAIWWYKSQQTGDCQVYTAAAPPEDNLRRLLWGEVNNLVSKHPYVFSYDKVRGMHIERSPLSFITGVTIPSSGTPEQREAKFSGKHAANLLFILDEADAIPVEVFRGIESCLSGGKGRLLCLYNPRSDVGPIAQLKAEGANVITMSAFNHPNVITGRNIIPGAVTRQKTVNRIYNWSMAVNEDGAGDVMSYGRFTVPKFLENYQGINEKTGDMLPPIPPGERIAIDSRFSYMVLGKYPGTTAGAIYDGWMDDYDQAKRDNREPQGNVTDKAEFEGGAGAIYWAIDEGYEGTIDAQTRSFTADSHPRAVLLCQVVNGVVKVFNESYKVKLRDDDHLAILEAMPYPKPELTLFGPGSKAISLLWTKRGYYKRTVTTNVEESIKLVRPWVSADKNGRRRLLVHPRCKHFRHEMKNYRRDKNGRIGKAFDHGPDGIRYLIWSGRNGF